MQAKTIEVIDLPKILDKRGNLSIVEEFKNIPFKIERVYWIYDVPGGEVRGGHAYKKSEEFIIALSGSFDVVLDNSECVRKYTLNRSYYGVYVPNGVWRRMENFSTNSLALVLSSTPYEPDDYIFDYEEFVKIKKILMTVFDCSIVELPKFEDRAGNLTPVYGSINIPFDVKRVFYSYDIPGGEARGAHAHKECHQLLVAASGSFEVVLDDGVNKRTLLLNRPFFGLHIPPGIWAMEQGFSSGSICLVLASHVYEEEDYIREYEEFVEYKIKGEKLWK